jgi:hypothetical protein
MSTEEQTRTEVIKSLIASNNALILLLQERAAAAQPLMYKKIEDTLTTPVITPQGPALPEHPATKKTRAKKVTEEPQPLGPPLTNPAEMNPPPTMADIKPTKPGKTLADLRVALQDCITKHGMPGAKERLAPFAKVSDVPDAEIDATIKRLLA